MPSSKGRLYVALYARAGAATMPGGEDAYHWALMVVPESGRSGTLFHAKQVMTVVDNQARSIWQFEERTVSMEPTSMVLIRVLVGKIRKRDRVEAILRQIPIRGEVTGWNCVYWVMHALAMLCQYQETESRIFDKYSLAWESVRQSVLQYVQYKRTAHRFDGQAEPGAFDVRKVATWDMLKGREKIP